jgi:hypothetical protein
LRDFVKTGMIMGLGFIPGVTIAALLKALFTVGEPQSNLYVAHFLSVQWFAPESFARLLSHCRTYAGNLGIVLCLVIAAGLIFYKKLPFLSRRALLIGIGASGLVCLMWTFKSSIPERYLAFSIMIFGLMVAGIVREYPRPTLIFCIFMLFSLFFRFPPAFKSDFRNALLSPVKAIHDVRASIQAPAQLRENFEDGSVILTNFARMAYITLDRPVTVAMPKFVDFMTSQGNERFDGIWIREHYSPDWPNKNNIIDENGISFQRIVPAGKPFPDGYCFYARVKE